ncbi:hypothetical protein [Aequorivita xiaoshiensis]|uniref:WG containing repeat-containing protein n=1 Tax=Aequorivita xiaoshiensis TaxID=2874476 RepID=A0A9X1R597_9FLAO|nr:hypothetical protein [Aequorivita xiaoshiensis]MCG2431289.1 hypothetical protein [Aequorivita xiaoshiensis]
MRYLLIILTTCVGLMLGCNSKNNSKTEVVTSEEIIAEKQHSNSEPQEYIEEANHLKYEPSETLYFSHAFIYKFTDEDNSKEFWLYHNPKNGQLLYVPEDEMIDYVISDPDGNYYFFGNDGHGNDVVDAQLVEWVANPEFYDENETYPISDQYVKLIPTGKKKVLNEYSKIDGKEIISEGYKWEFTKMNGEQFTFITNIIPVNFYQVYGFNKLEGDISLPYSSLDFVGVFGKNQTITEFISGKTKVELLSYEFNPYFVEAANYQYVEQLPNGDWVEKSLPLLKPKK